MMELYFFWNPQFKSLNIEKIIYIKFIVTKNIYLYVFQ